METKEEEEQFLGIYKIRTRTNGLTIAAPGARAGDRYVAVRRPRGVLVYYPVEEYKSIQGEGGI